MSKKAYFSADQLSSEVLYAFDTPVFSKNRDIENEKLIDTKGKKTFIMSTAQRMLGLSALIPFVKAIASSLKESSESDRPVAHWTIAFLLIGASLVVKKIKESMKDTIELEKAHKNVQKVVESPITWENQLAIIEASNAVSSKAFSKYEQENPFKVLELSTLINEANNHFDISQKLDTQRVEKNDYTR